MTRKFLAFFLLLIPVIAFAQQPSAAKYALVIGNGAYTDLGRLVNPVNDANDMAAALESLGFIVDKLLNASLEQMEESLTRLRNRLGASPGAYGFFFYAGHGVQSNGENYLIPVNANIPSESYLRNRAVSVQVLLDDLNEAQNHLNVVVLDACRDNPFGWSRSGTRGLAIVGRQPADSIIVYATSAGQQASDGEGRNGLFTSQLLPNLTTPGLEVKEIFNRTGLNVSEASGRRQIPAIYNQFFGTAYLSSTDTIAVAPSPSQPATAMPLPTAPPQRERGVDARLWTVGASAGTSFAVPWVIGTIHGTIAPFRYSFLEIGLDAGFVSGDAEVGYYSLCPFAHYAFYYNAEKIGLYAGAGGGYTIAEYSGSGGELSLRIPALDLTAGLRFTSGFTVSYTLRTDFATAGNKLAVGYLYRF
jgi:hypothetical protein